MKINFSSIEGTVTIYMCGELDESDALKVRNILDEYLEKIKPLRIIYDLSELTFMDSTGIGILVGRYKKFNNNPSSFFISHPNFMVDKILKLSGIYTIMPKIDNIDYKENV